jgi:hypothetical protein
MGASMSRNPMGLHGPPQGLFLFFNKLVFTMQETVFWDLEEDGFLHSNRRENLKSYIVFTTL